MSEPFLGEIRIFPYNFAPRGWAFCNGQLLPISQNTALFSLVGTTYGGDGRTTFGLPDLQGRVPLHPGRGPGLTERRLGEKGGQSQVDLSLAQMAAHSHVIRASQGLGDQSDPASHSFGVAAAGRQILSMYSPDAGSSPPMNAAALAHTGGNQPHNNLSPHLILNFCIALVGLYPSRA